MHKNSAGFLIIIIVCALMLTGCAFGLKNPYKGQGPVFEITKAELLNQAETPNGSLGDEDFFVVRIEFDAFNVMESVLGDKRDQKARVMDLLTGRLFCIEVEDYADASAAIDSTNLRYSKTKAVVKGAVLYYLVPVQYRNEELKFVVYNTTDTKARKILFETSNFNKSNFNSEQYQAAQDTGTQEALSPAVKGTDKMQAAADGILYTGTADFPQARKFAINLVFSDDQTKVKSLEIQIDHLRLEQKSGNMIRTIEVENLNMSSGMEYPVQNGKVRIDCGDCKLDLVVLDSCAYGIVSYSYQQTNSTDAPIELGTVQTVLTNVTNPSPLPDNLTELMSQFKD